MAELWLGTAGAERVTLPADALTTHAVCVGMTGSGKTGLCVGLLEELANAGIPIIAIDPKGDLTNLALVEPDVAVASEWRAGQARDGVTPAEVARWAGTVEVHLWTPGSDAGLAVNVLAALRRPAGVFDDESRRELVIGSVSALLGLVGEAADPVRSPAHIVLSRLLEDAWVRGEDPDLEALLGGLVDPPFVKIGVFPTDKFFPPDDRLALAMRLNALLASPAFAAWSTGTPLDIPALLSPVNGRAPIHVFTLAHLSEPERHFFVGILLDRVAAWTRGLPGSARLRACVFFDEVWGYLPPHPKDPPAKRPLLALLKQARAVGVGVVLATQNPVDLDYKALSNAGTWFVGRLQTRNDRDRVTEGLTGAGMERAEVEALLDSVGARRFVLQRAGQPPRLFTTRCTRVWLAGPLTRPQIRALVDARSGDDAPAGSLGESAEAPSGGVRGAVPPGWAGGAPFGGDRPGSLAAVLRAVEPARTGGEFPHRRNAPPGGQPPGPPAAGAAAAVGPSGGARAPAWKGPQWFLDPRVVFSARLEGALTPWAEPGNGAMRLRPALLVRLFLRFDEEKAGYVDEREEHRVYFPLEEALPLAALVLPLTEADLLTTPVPGAVYDPLPDWIDEPRELDRVVKDVVAGVLASESQGTFANPALKLYARPGEARAAFDARCAAAVQARVDDAVAALQATYAKRGDAVDAKVRRLEERRTREASVHAGRQAEEWINVGETVLAFFTGRSKSLSTVATRRRQVVVAGQRVDEVESELAAAREEGFAIEQELAEKVAALGAREATALQATVEREIRLEREDVRVVRAGLLWVPVTRRL